MSAKQLQNDIVKNLKRKFSPELLIEDEWRSFYGVQLQYAPRVDIAVGPFSTEVGKSKSKHYNEILDRPHIIYFLKQLYRYHCVNSQKEENASEFETLIYKNQNARCFLAFEIENTNSKKHIMGSMVNAASLGRIGIGISYQDSAKRTFLRIIKYLAFLNDVGKNSYNTTNFLVVTAEQIKILLEID